MAELTDLVLAHLQEVGFRVRAGGAMPFGETLPLVTGVAWETETAQLALIAEGRGELELPAWRQLLFAGSGIRHQLAGDDASAFGTPVVVAIVDEKAARALRRLAEELAEDFAVFNRVDLNLVPASDVGHRERLDDALAPLLPRCRRLRGEEISRQEVQRFWALLRSEVEKAAGELDPSFGAQRDTVGRECAAALIGESAEAEELPSPAPIGTIAVRHLRSIESLQLELADVSVFHGPNGSGKTTLVEALELAWAGSSQRRPSEVAAQEYGEHLPRGGSGEFAIEVDGRVAGELSDTPRAQLNRCVLTHEAIAELASEAPARRFSALLEVTGLEIPDLKSRTEALLRESKREADEALAAAGMTGLPRTSSVGLKHLREELKSELLSRYSALPDLATAEGALSSLSGGSFSPRRWPGEERARQLVEQADLAVAEGIEGRMGEAELGKALDAACEALAELLGERAQAAASSRQLLEALREQVRATRAAPQSQDAEPPQEGTEPPLGVSLAARWLSHSKVLRGEAERFRAEAGELADEDWSERLRGYAEALMGAAELAPQRELERLSQPRAAPRPAPAKDIDKQALLAAGFREGVIDAESVGPALREVTEALETHVAELRALANASERHPARHFAKHSERVMAALCRFELARGLRREGPILQASEALVGKLLDERLTPVVRELVAAIVRFEWYFKPLKMSSGSRRVVLGGLATDRGDLDARLLLNSAERSVLGLAWFLALHMLQPPERRQVLVLDDPTSGFDDANTAGFASTLRAFVRLLRPKQVVVATHDDRVAAMLAEELAVVDGWPVSVARVRFRRDADDCSVASEEWALERERAVEHDAEELGLLDEAPAG